MVDLTLIVLSALLSPGTDLLWALFGAAFATVAIVIWQAAD